MITKAALSVLLGFVLSVVLGFVLIPFLKKIKASQSVSVYLKRAHKNKEGTPTMGGIIFILPVIFIVFILLITSKIQFSYTLVILLFTFVSYGLIGFIDDYLIIKKRDNKGLSKWQKLLLQIIVATIFFYLFMEGGNEPLIWIHSLHLKLNIGFLYGIFILFVLVASSNAVNLTDGLDGLAAGLAVISFFTFGVLSFQAGWLFGYEDIGIMAFALVGSLLGFLVFNMHPARVFMGDTGSLALGALLGAYAIMTRHEVLLLFIGFVFAIETISCIIQIIYFKITGKRFFLMTPIHHSFEKKGFKENDIVRLFWLVGIIASLISLIWGVVL